ncbi:MAG: hypothetical protein ABSD64_13500 [Terriglobales bacterium]|jgi:hypothetical protein
MYGVGFVILSAYEARYGIVQFGPLRARIFLVGFVFSALSAFAVAAHHYGLAYYGPLQKVMENADPALRSERAVVLACGFTFTAYLMAAMFSLFLFVQDVPIPRPRYLWIRVAALAVGWLAFYLVNRWMARRFTENPEKSAILAALASFALFGAVSWMGPEEIVGLALWFWMAAMFGLAARSSQNRMLYALDFRVWIGIVLSISIYVTSVVGHMQQKFGGGAPVPAVVYLSKPFPLSNGATTVEVSLLDETEQGYYVLPPGRHRALFIPRGEVVSIYFGPATDLPKSP